MFNASPSLADIAAVTGNRNGDGFGDGNGWWVLIILFALFGWGRGGFGANNGGDSCGCCTPASCGDLQRGFDNQTVVNKLNGLENGICSLGYDQLAQMNGINQNITQTGFGIQNAITQMGIANMQDTNALSRQLADCCCENRAAIAQVRYDMATDTCAITTAIGNASRDIIDNANCNYRALHDEFVAFRIAQKDEKIAEQQALIDSLNLAVSQRNQNDYLISQLRPCPTPSYNVPNPFCCNNGYFNGNCGCNNGCGC